MSIRAEAFDRWIRTSFVEINTALENLYFAQDDRANVEGVGDALKSELRDEGHGYVVDLQREGNTGEGFESGFGVLGNVGLYMGALRRHELTNPDREEKSPFVEASSLAFHVGASLGMAPRFATAHLATHNLARRRRAEELHLARRRVPVHRREHARHFELSAHGRRADADRRARRFQVRLPTCCSRRPRTALRDVIRFNARLFEKLDVDRFFFSVRPYYKPYRVGRMVYRGANAGDFSGINEIDLLLGLCRASDPYYAQLLVDKMLFMLPADQARLRECMTHRSLLDEFLLLVDEHSRADWFQANARAFLEVCDLFGQTAAQHHDQLVSRFIVAPAAKMPEERLEGITASGPPLPVLIRSLELLRDYRVAAARPDLETRHDDLARLRGDADVTSG